MNLTQISYFLALAKYKSFKQTAENLYVSQPAVSIQISSLEKEWGFPLFIRKYKDLILTPQGEIMYKALSECEASFSSAYKTASSLDENKEIHICIGIPERSFSKDLPNLIAAYQNSHPRLFITLASCSINQLTLSKENNKYDLVINQDYLLSKRKDIRKELLLSRHRAFFISKNLLQYKNADPFSFSDLRNITLYLPEADGDKQTTTFLQEICEKEGYTPSKIIYLQNVDSVLLAVRMGFGITIIDDLVSVPDEYEIDMIPIQEPVDWMLAWRNENDNQLFHDLAKYIRENIT